MQRKFWTMAAAAALLTVGAAAPAAAGDFTVEGQFGYYDPDSINENGEVFGVGVGYKPSDNFGMLLSAGVLDLEDDFLDIENANLRFDLFLVDLSFQWFPTGKGFYLFAGPGFATVDVEVDIPGNNNDLTESQSSFTVNGGVGYQWQVGEKFFVRPLLLARWYDGQDFQADNVDSWDGLDVQYSVGLGWKF